MATKTTDMIINFNKHYDVIFNSCFKSQQLPAYSPDINAIEMLWKKTRRGVTHNRYFNTLKEMTNELFDYWARFSEPNQELARLYAFI